MANYNKVVLIGHLTHDPELKYTPSGTPVCEVGLAVNDRVKKGEEWVEEVTFVPIVLFGRTAEVLNEYLKKGDAALFEGRLRLDQWEKDGQKRSKMKVVAEKMRMLGGKRPTKNDAEESADMVAAATGEEIAF